MCEYWGSSVMSKISASARTLAANSASSTDSVTSSTGVGLDLGTTAFSTGRSSVLVVASTGGATVDNFALGTRLKKDLDELQVHNPSQNIHDSLDCAIPSQRVVVQWK
jgi:hypothetical protein